MTNDRNIRLMAVNWLKGNRIFENGINILMKTSFKPGVVGKLYRIGKNAPAAMERLTYLMREFVSVFGKSSRVEDTDAELHVFAGEESAADTPDKKSRAILAAAERKDAPERIGKVIHEYASLYKQRAKAFRLLKEVGEKNDAATMARRKEHSDAIDKATTRMEKLYPLYESYLSLNKDITETELESVIIEKVAENVSGKKTIHKDLNSMSRVQLKKERKRLEVKRTRTKNMLLYQQYTRQPVENPIPESPAKIKYTKILERLNHDIEEIDYVLAKNFS